MPNNSVKIFGEVLFDHFTDGTRVLGGAPFNVAWHLQAFGQKPQFISRIGTDKTGNQIREAMQAWKMDLDCLQQDSVYPTGQVQVTIAHGEPSYAILPDQAYDFIQLQDLTENNHKGILYHGTLVARSPQSRQTLTSLKASHQGKVFIDVNLRQPWWNKADILQLINDADWLKLNIHELHALHEGGLDIKTSMANFLMLHKLEAIIVTRGEEGALALNDSGDFFSVAPTESVNIVDTVGAGDAFSAVLLVGFNLGWPLEVTIKRAQVFATAVIGQRGATASNLSFYQPFKSSWRL
jgi:fructokinase